MSDPIDELIDATDEAADSPPPERRPAETAIAARRPRCRISRTAGSPGRGRAFALTGGRGRIHPGRLDSCARDEREPAALPAPVGIRDLFAQLQVRREPSGKVIIEAPAEAAGELGALFEGMAALLQSIGRQ